MFTLFLSPDTGTCLRNHLLKLSLISVPSRFLKSKVPNVTLFNFWAQLIQPKYLRGLLSSANFYAR